MLPSLIEFFSICYVEAYCKVNKETIFEQLSLIYGCYPPFLWLTSPSIFSFYSSLIGWEIELRLVEQPFSFLHKSFYLMLSICKYAKLSEAAALLIYLYTISGAKKIHQIRLTFLILKKSNEYLTIITRLLSCLTCFFCLLSHHFLNERWLWSFSFFFSYLCPALLFLYFLYLFLYFYRNISTIGGKALFQSCRRSLLVTKQYNSISAENKRFFSSKDSSSTIQSMVVYKDASIDKEKILEDNLGLSGVYRWTNLTNGKSYIGSSGNLSKRFRCYFSANYLTRNRMVISKALLKHKYFNFSFLCFGPPRPADPISCK